MNEDAREDTIILAVCVLALIVMGVSVWFL
ncbi:hypothetical protein [Providencia phage PSTRCR_114]|uniref:Uncharacterized protein n=1 Tax=Providencia phage PSTRCR_114 TaxID=2800824 RepID=A0A7T6ZM35_9CAUD|nr:hypothetical protein [Providencia phage PSTRCR_114]